MVNPEGDNANSKLRTSFIVVLLSVENTICELWVTLLHLHLYLLHLDPQKQIQWLMPALGRFLLLDIYLSHHQ